MNREILIDALEELDGGLIERYFETKEKLKKKRIGRKGFMRWSAVAACLVLCICAVIPIVMKYIKPVVLPDNGQTFDAEDLVFEGYVLVGSKYIYTDWNGLDTSSSLNFCLESNKKDTEALYAINVFRRNGKRVHVDYIYNGKTYTEIVEEMSYPRSQGEILKELILMYGEILKYGKEVVTVEGIPEDDMLVIPSDRGLCWPEEYYDRIVTHINENDPETLSRYIVNGDFLSEKAQEDFEMLSAECREYEKALAEMLKAYFCSYEPEDVAFFEEIGCVTGERNGKLYIIVSQEEFAKLSENDVISKYSFTLLPMEDFYTE